MSGRQLLVFALPYFVLFGVLFLLHWAIMRDFVRYHEASHEQISDFYGLESHRSEHVGAFSFSGSVTTIVPEDARGELVRSLHAHNEIVGYHALVLVRTILAGVGLLGACVLWRWQA